MFKWSATVAVNDSSSIKGRAKILSEAAIIVCGDGALPLRSHCLVCIVLPEKPGGHVFRQIPLHCSVTRVVFSTKGIQLEMSVKHIRPRDREVLREHTPAYNH